MMTSQPSFQPCSRNLEPASAGICFSAATNRSLDKGLLNLSRLYVRSTVPWRSWNPTVRRSKSIARRLSCSFVWCIGVKGGRVKGRSNQSFSVRLLGE